MSSARLELDFTSRDRIKAELVSRLEAAREAIEHPQADESTNMLRGEIRVLRDLIERVAPSPPKKPEPVSRQLTPTPAVY